MSTQSKATSPRRKTKSVSQPKPIKLTPWMIEDHARRQAYKDWHFFLGNHTEAEWNVVRHLKVGGHGGIEGLMKEIRRLLGESAAKCKIIPFPVVNKHRII